MATDPARITTPERTSEDADAARGRQMMRVGDRDRQRVGGVGPGDLHAGKQPRDHGVDLCLLGAAGADDRFLDEASGIFAHVEAGASRAHENHSTRLPEL